MKKKLMMALSLVLVAALSIGGTVAYLTDVTETKTNTFTVGNVDIELKETTTNYKMVPGKDIAKDPKITVEGGSEACWLFVEIDESDNLDYFISYNIADGWTELENGVYWREVAAADADQSFDVLKGNKVTTNADVTKTDMDNLTDETRPTLAFTAYAIQKEGFADASAAWGGLNTPAEGETA